MFLTPVLTPGLAQISYVVGDGEHAAVIDPRRDVRVYHDLARANGARITHVFETHRNEDFVSGALDLARLTGAEIYHGMGLPFEYGSFVTEGEAFTFGKLRLSVLSTPGHTDESLSLVLSDLSFSPEPVAVFTGDALFVGEVGRTDFFPARAAEVAAALHESLFGKLLPLGDHVLLYPAHTAGSVCGGSLARRRFSSLGYERRHNPVLQFTEQDEFVRFKLAERHYLPPYFRRMEDYNLRGAPPWPAPPEPSPLSAAEFAAGMTGEMLVVDVRSPEAFGGAHVPGSLALPLEQISAWAGWFLDYQQPLGLVVEEAHEAQEAALDLGRLGYDRVEGFLAEGMHDWETRGRRFEGVRQVYIAEVIRRLEEQEPFLLLDVRTEREWQAGHLPRALHLYLGELPDRLEEVPRDRPVVTFCGSGHRAIIAASILLRAGFTQVENCLGSMAACRALGCPLE